MKYVSFFSGIGGIDLGLDRAGYECAAQIEIDPFCQKVLEKHWPGVPRYGDIAKIHGKDLPYADLFAGGFPCQDLSQAGKRAGIEGARSGLWFEFARLIREVRPKYVIAENVPGLLVRGALDRVIGELAGCGYVGCWRCLRASEFGASHLRKRVFLIATLDDADGRERLRQQPCEDRRSFADGRCAELADGNEQYRGQNVRRRPRQRIEDGCGGSLADTNQRGRGLDSETHHDNGHHASRYDTDGCDPVVADGSGAHTGYYNGSYYGGGKSEMADSECDGTGSGPSEMGRAAGSGEEHAAQERVTRRQDGRTGFTLAPLAGGIDLGYPDDPRWIPAGIGRDFNAGNEPEAGCGGLEFAPGPSDPRWGTILRERPDLAPALANPVSGCNAKRHAGRNDNGPDGPEGKVRQPSGAGIGGDAGDGTATAEPEICRMADGLSDWMDRAMSNRAGRLGRLGNAVVPQVAEWLGRRLLEFDRSRDLKRCIETAREWRDELLAGHPDVRGIKLGISDQVLEETLIRLDL